MTTNMPGPVADPLHAPSNDCGSLLAILDVLDKEFDRLGLALAHACSINRTLDEQLLARQQIVCNEFALAAAELMAARQFIELALRSDNLRDATLAQLFVLETMPDIVRRLDLIANALGAPPISAHSLHGSTLNPLRAGASPAALEAAGQIIIENGDAFREIKTNEQVDMARDVFRKFGQKVVAPIAEEIHRDDLDIPEELLERMREMGVFGLSVPERYGGSAPNEGEDNLSMIAITEALSEASLGAAGSLITRPEILTRAILAGGTELQKAGWLPQIAAGDPLCAIAITEPDFGSDVASLALKATRTAGGWLFSGAKTWCTFAGKAGVLMVVARTGPGSGYKGLSILLVEKPAFEGREFQFEQPDGGTLRGKAIPTIGYRGMHSFDLSFTDFFVPDANLLGGEGGLGRGFYFTMNGMTGGRIQTAARACGVMIAATSAAIRYARDRKIFGLVLADHQLTKAKIAKMVARLQASRQLAYHVAGLLNSGGGQMEASLAKLFACRCAEIVTREAQQIHGGMGYAEESAVSRYFVDARVLSIFEGAEEALALRVVARGILNDHLRGINA